VRAEADGMQSAGGDVPADADLVLVEQFGNLLHVQELGPFAMDCWHLLKIIALLLIA
jgi:hypothetical protein